GVRHGVVDEDVADGAVGVRRAGEIGGIAKEGHVMAVGGDRGIAASANDGGVAAVAGKAARRSRRSVRRLHRRKTLLLWRVSTRLADRMRRSMRPAPSLSVRQNRTARASAAGVAADGAADGATAAG